MKNSVTPQIVAHIAKLANIPVTQVEQEKLAAGFSETLDVIDELNKLDVKNVPTAHQVTGLENVWREDTINPNTIFTQQEALANAAQTHNGFFVVSRILEEKDA
ncbi:MAG: hypothetical protein AUK08_00185 [Candidatus Pacebacteria bacterium CG2_30_36_39]|nr:Asp-tRNA(Asn)/Glu-tRNA(Gln) amidotransferase subunit GatC [Candidatus Pacearchaeota archaeon]OIP74526.1 MAG: hypothetical protein AUK08_00185 [Candidatus Pacebacteria bacterium CG2_30_36_39]